MSRSGQFYYAEYVRACDAYGADEISEGEFRRRLEKLGYEEYQIDAEIEAANEFQR